MAGLGRAWPGGAGFGLARQGMAWNENINRRHDMQHGFFDNLNTLRADALAAWGHTDDREDECDDHTPDDLAADIAAGWCV